MSDRSISDELAQEGFFAGLDAQALQFLVEHAQRQEAECGKILFRHGNHADHFYLISKGQVSIEIPAITGPTLQLQQLGPGRILGWSWLIPPYKWSFQARVEEDCSVIVIDGAAVLAHCEEEPRFGYDLFKRFSTLMSRRLSEARARMMDEWNPAGFA